MASPQQINRHRLRVVTYVISGVWCLLFLLATIGNIEIRKNVMSELNKDLHRPDAIFIKGKSVLTTIFVRLDDNQI